LFDSVFLIAMTAWVGSILFFSFGVAPLIFKVLGPEAGSRFVRALFPRYYLWGAIAGAISLPALVAGPLCFPEYRHPLVGLEALAIIASVLVMLYAGNSLTPEINRARDAGDSGHTRFERLHRRSVYLNGVVLLVGLVILVAFAARPAPRTAGIIEKSPAERILYDTAISRVMRRAEIKYGLRPPEADPFAPAADEPVIDQETIQEIDELYAQKRLRDEARAKRRGDVVKPLPNQSPALPPPKSTAIDTPGPPRSGKPGTR
jgi:hypothetical protein